jgi:xanthine dehydrogenase small subunit
MAPFSLLAPATEEEALALLAEGRSGSLAVLAGGTDLLVDLEERRLVPERVLSLRRLPWRTHAWEGDGLHLGSTEPLVDLEADPELAVRFPALAEAIAAVGSPALRRQATVGGNLGRAAPASDLTPVLLVLDAEVELLGPSGARWCPVDAFLRASRETDLRPGELIRSVRLPEPRPASAYLWQRVRPANDISQIGVAVAFSPGDRRWRVGLGGVPPRPVLVPEVARELAGPQPSRQEILAASEVLGGHPGLVTDRRATEEHRRRLASALCSRALRSVRAAEVRRP